MKFVSVNFSVFEYNTLARKNYTMLFIKVQITLLFNKNFVRRFHSRLAIRQHLTFDEELFLSVY